MPEVIFPGPDGRIEGRYHPAKEKGSPVALLLHPHPQLGGTMNNQIVYKLYYTFANRGFAVLRFNFRGVGRSQGTFRLRARRIVGCGGGARLAPGEQRRQPQMLDRRASPSAAGSACSS